MSNRLARKFTKPTQVSKHLICAICTEIFYDPIRLSCSHTFCLSCISSWCGQGTTCPECRTPINTDLMGKDLIADKIIQDLEVSCIHKLCTWKDRLELLDKHIKFCPYEKTPDWLSKLQEFSGPILDSNSKIDEDNEEFVERINEEVVGRSLTERLFVKNESTKNLLESVFDKESGRKRRSFRLSLLENPFNLYDNLLDSGSKNQTPSREMEQIDKVNNKENIFSSLLKDQSKRISNHNSKGSNKKENIASDVFPGKRNFDENFQNTEFKDSKTRKINQDT